MRLISDVHLEFGNYDIVPMDGDEETILVLAGDITTGVKHKDFVTDACKQFKEVIYIHGNHEYYRNEYHSVIRKWRKIADEIDNLHFLFDESIILDGIRFFGGTMWTDFYNSDWFAMYNAKQNMGCFHAIKLEEAKRYRKLQPADTVRFHNEYRRKLESELSQDFDGKTVVISHHMPTYDCVCDPYKTSPLNPAFHANMEDILGKYNIDYWFYGHTHTSQQFNLGDTVLVNNSRGYEGHEDPDELGFNPTLRFEI